jgi:hypothetical protein
MMKELLNGFILEEKPTANHPVLCRDLNVKSKIVWFEKNVKLPDNYFSKEYKEVFVS